MMRPRFGNGQVAHVIRKLELSQKWAPPWFAIFPNWIQRLANHFPESVAYVSTLVKKSFLKIDSDQVIGAVWYLE